MSSKTVLHDQLLAQRKLLITAEDYQRMGTAGIFTNKPRVELLDGQIYTMSPFTPKHNAHVDKIAEFFIISLFKKAKVRVQGSFRSDPYSEPEPDITVLKFDENFYEDRPAEPKDILLIIEVAISTATTDQTVKKEKYAMAGIPEYWIVLPERGVIEVYRQPEQSDYIEKITYDKTNEWLFESFDQPIKGSDLLI